jgi:hypothetical protein
MTSSIVEALTEEVAYIHAQFFEAVDELDDERFALRPGPKAPSVSFHLWHTARWADAFQARLGTFAPQLDRFAGRDQVWEARGLAERWGLSRSLGKEATGAGLDDDASASLPLPAKHEVVSYARDAFAAAEEVYGSIEDDELTLATADFYDEGEWIVLNHFGWHVGHAARHLGMIEALKGVMGLEGTVTV